MYLMKMDPRALVENPNHSRQTWGDVVDLRHHHGLRQPVAYFSKQDGKRHRIAQFADKQFPALKNPAFFFHGGFSFGVDFDLIFLMSHFVVHGRRGGRRSGAAFE